jgi:type VI secretion system protein ImpH
VSDAARIEAARRAGFYPLVLALEAIAGGPPVGSALDPAEERVRFRHDPALSFSTGDVSSVREVRRDAGDAEHRAFEVTTTFLGLTGGVTPLPHYIAEEVAQEEPDAAQVRAFLDLFHHRMLSLFVSALAAHDVANGWRSSGTDPWTRRLLAILGLDAAQEGVSLPLPPWRLLRLAPLLGGAMVTADALESAIADALLFELGEVNVTVEPFVGTWAAIAPDEVTRLGRQGGRLGQDCVLGQRVYDVAGKFRVVVGPLDAELYQRAQKGGVPHVVKDFVTALITEPLDFDVELSLAAGAAPVLTLGASRLGRDAWLGGQSFDAQVDAFRAA